MIGLATPSDNEFVQSTAEMFGQGDWTLGDLVAGRGIGSDGPLTVGSPTAVADELQEWIEETGIDGFNIANVITPGSFVDFVDLVVPELQRRGVYPTEYQPGTLREKLFGRGARLPKNHRGARYRHTARRA